MESGPILVMDSGRRRAMIEAIIEWSIRNRFLVILAALARRDRRRPGADDHAGRRDPRPVARTRSSSSPTGWAAAPRRSRTRSPIPLSVNLQGLAGVKVVRSSSEFNFSMITSSSTTTSTSTSPASGCSNGSRSPRPSCPPGVTPYLAPDATALGQIFWYTVEGDGRDLGELRSIQDWYVRYQLNSVPGVAEVASVGGVPREYQVDLDPNKLRAYGISLGEVYSAVARSNSAVGGRVIHKGNAEYLIRSVGWIKDLRRPREHRRRPARTGRRSTCGTLGAVQLGPAVPPQRAREGRQGGRRRRGHDALRREPARGHPAGQGEDREPPGRAPRRRPDRPLLRPHAADPQGAATPSRDTVKEEMVICTVAILLIMGHLGSAFVVCSRCRWRSCSAS